MSRSFYRFFAATAFVAALPLAASAQVNCVRIGSGTATCTAVNATLTVPKVTRLTVASNTAIETPATFNTTFFEGAAADSTFTRVALAYRTNYDGDVTTTVSAGALTGTATSVAGNSRSRTDFAYKGVAAATCTGGSYVAFDGTDQSLATADGSPTPLAGSEDYSLCIRTIFDPTDLTKLREGTYIIPLTLKITAP